MQVLNKTFIDEKLCLFKQDIIKSYYEYNNMVFKRYFYKFYAVKDNHYIYNTHYSKVLISIETLKTYIKVYDRMNRGVYIKKYKKGY
jgi:predicted metal-dependent HD superfamily phosphohydrolase